MKETIRIADQLERSFNGGAWHGPALLEILAKVNAKQAAARPIESAHNICEIVLHIAAWEGVTRAWMAGELSALPELRGLADWPLMPEATAAAWKRTVYEAVAIHNELLKLVKKRNDSQLTKIVPGRKYSLYFLLHGLVQHNLYHAGQIALLKKQALEDRANSPR